jgi:hypothetical protein
MAETTGGRTPETVEKVQLPKLPAVCHERRKET